MASLLEELRKDPTSRFFGVPQDLTRLIRTFLRPLDGPLNQIAVQRHGRGLGLTLDDRLIIQSDDTNQTHVVSLPDLTILQTLTLPRCRKIWALQNGEFFSQLDDSRFGYQDQTYSFTLTAMKIHFVLTTTLTEPGLNFPPGWSDQVEVTPEGKIYLSYQNSVYEYDLVTPTPSRWLFRLPLGRHVMKGKSNKLYISLINALLICHVESGTLKFSSGCRSRDPGHDEVLIMNRVLIEFGSRPRI